jgi:hypothetical protein
MSDKGPSLRGFDSVYVAVVLVVPARIHDVFCR